MKKHILIMTSIIVVISAGLVAFFLNIKYTPLEASYEARPIDILLTRLLIVAAPIFTLCMVTMIYSCVVFRRRRGDDEDGPAWRGHAPTEIVWTLIPLAIVLIFGVYGTIVLRDITRAPFGGKELEIKVTASQWNWRFEYPEYNVTSAELRLPIDRPVLFHLNATDVIHSFWVPEFRVKQDAVPGMETFLRITPSRMGDYKAYCNQLCGLAHTYMIAPVKVVDTPAFEQWVKEQRSK